MVPSGIALPAAQKDLCPLPPGFLWNGSLGLSSGLTPQSSWECLWATLQQLRTGLHGMAGGLVTGPAGPPAGELRLGREEGARHASPSGRTATETRPACSLSPTPVAMAIF